MMLAAAVVVCARTTLADIALSAASAFGTVLALAAVVAWVFRGK